MKSAIQLLKEARATLAYPDQLTRFQPACDVLGRTVSPLHPAARRWCSTGAVIKAAGTESGEEIDLALAALQRAMEGSIPKFHDHRLRYEILEKFDEAILMLEHLDREDIIPFGAVVIEHRVDLSVMRARELVTTA